MDTRPAPEELVLDRLGTVKETARYVHLSQRHLHTTPRPLDALVLKKGRSSRRRYYFPGLDLGEKIA